VLLAQAAQVLSVYLGCEVRTIAVRVELRLIELDPDRAKSAKALTQGHMCHGSGRLWSPRTREQATPHRLYTAIDPDRVATRAGYEPMPTDRRIDCASGL